MSRNIDVEMEDDEDSDPANDMVGFDESDEPEQNASKNISFESEDEEEDEEVGESKKIYGIEKKTEMYKRNFDKHIVHKANDMHLKRQLDEISEDLLSYLLNDFNVLVHGFGSKRRLLNQFCSAHAQYEYPVLILNGYH